MGGDVAADIGKRVFLVRGHNELIEMVSEEEKSDIRSATHQKSRALSWKYTLDEMLSHHGGIIL